MHLVYLVLKDVVVISVFVLLLFALMYNHAILSNLVILKYYLRGYRNIFLDAVIINRRHFIAIVVVLSGINFNSRYSLF